MIDFEIIKCPRCGTEGRRRVNDQRLWCEVCHQQFKSDSATVIEANPEPAEARVGKVHRFDPMERLRAITELVLWMYRDLVDLLDGSGMVPSVIPDQLLREHELTEHSTTGHCSECGDPLIGACDHCASGASDIPKPEPKRKPKRIKVTGCSNPKFWYKHVIGQEFEVNAMVHGNYHVSPDDVVSGSINPNDAKVVEWEE